MEKHQIKINYFNNDVQGARIIENDDWVWKAIVFPRTQWDLVKNDKYFNNIGVYILIGYDGEYDEQEKIYVGQAAGGVQHRIDNHIIDSKKDFWELGIAILSEKFNKSHIQWLESSLCQRAKDMKNCILENRNEPAKPISLDENSISFLERRLREILQVVGIIGINAFDKAIIKEVSSQKSEEKQDIADNIIFEDDGTFDTVVVPCKGDDRFNNMFMKESLWHSIRLNKLAREKIKYLATYRTSPISAITHWAKVKDIVNAENGKYQLNFEGKSEEFAQPIERRRNGDQLQGPRYTNLETLLKAKVISDVWP